MQYDIIIIGGGIGTLHFLYNLYKINSKAKILLLEKNNYLGGRIKTFRIDLNNHIHQFELGAGRFNDNHISLIKLIHELDLQNFIIKINSNIDFKPSQNTFNNNYTKGSFVPNLKNKNPFDYINNVIKIMELEDKNILNKYTFQEYILEHKLLSISDFNFILDSYGYYSELVEMNAYNALNLFKNGINNNLQYYSLSCGLDKIIYKILEKIKLLNIDIKLNTEIKKIKYFENKKTFTAGTILNDTI